MRSGRSRTSPIPPRSCAVRRSRDPRSDPHEAVDQHSGGRQFSGTSQDEPPLAVLLTASALGMAIGGPILTALTIKLNERTILIGTMILSSWPTWSRC